MGAMANGIATEIIGQLRATIVIFEKSTVYTLGIGVGTVIRIKQEMSA
jgi:hypothetical protein